MKNEAFQGKWILNYDPSLYSYKDILEALIEKKPLYKISNNTNIHSPKFPKIKTVGLSYMALLSDKRWKTLHLTASSLFLGSALSNHQLGVKIVPHFLPSSVIDPNLLKCDLIGLTLFEDFFQHSTDFLRRLKEQYKFNGLIAAGGPQITLNPFPSTYHFPEINLMIRGEAEVIFPKIIKCLNNQDFSQLLNFSGLLFQIPGLIIISNFDRINQIQNFNGFQFNLDFIDKKQLQEGLELNVSRGCNRGCFFCSALQGKKYRKLPLHHLENLLELLSKKIAQSNIQSSRHRYININDDDILQDLDYAQSVFQLIKKHNFQIWGIQTSIRSLFTQKGEINKNILKGINDPSLFAHSQPLLWIGTDAFIKKRGIRLGKWIPTERQIQLLIETLQKEKVQNYHYWISSDHLTNWEEFISELKMIYTLLSFNRFFGILPHAPFLVPYSSTPIYKRLTASEYHKSIKYKFNLSCKHKDYSFPLVDKIETQSSHLNRLLNNEKLNNKKGFFDYLKLKDFKNSWITLYNFLRQERLETDDLINKQYADHLRELESNVETIIQKILK